MRLVGGTVTVGDDGAAGFADVESFVAELGGVGDATDCTVQAFDARYVAGREHLASALAHADRAFGRGENVANERAVEVLLYAAGRRQIRRAFAMGVDEGETPVAVLVAADETASDVETAEAEAAGSVAALLDDRSEDARDPERIREFFDVTDAEAAATDASLEDLVRERVALLDVEK